MTLRALSAMVSTVLVAAAVSCSSSTGDSKSLKSRQSIPLPLNVDAIDGSGTLLGYAFADASHDLQGTLQVFARDGAHPNELLDLGTVPVGLRFLGVSTRDVRFTSDRAVIAIASIGSPGGWVALVSLGATSATLQALIPLTTAPDHAIASGRWLLVVSGAHIGLLDVANPSAPLDAGSFTAAATVRSLLPVSEGFLAFTDAGYVHVALTPGPPAFGEVIHPDLRMFTKVIAVTGGKAWAGGPSPFAGKSRVAILDVGGTPALLDSRDVPGAFVDFACDGASEGLLETTPSFDASPPAAHVGFIVTDDGAALRLDQVPLGSYSYRGSHLYAWSGRIYALDWYVNALVIYSVE